ncbi:MAG: flavodoxin-dependent (E)-4-hydroxy-3-methylbut-2-enyl-diphosphate synthase, partial [Planctomycetota bacterium]
MGEDLAEGRGVLLLWHSDANDVCAGGRELVDLSDAGIDLVRVAVPEKKDTAALREILAQTRVPIVADV